MEYSIGSAKLFPCVVCHQIVQEFVVYRLSRLATINQFKPNIGRVFILCTHLDTLLNILCAHLDIHLSTLGEHIADSE